MIDEHQQHAPRVLHLTTNRINSARVSAISRRATSSTRRLHSSTAARLMSVESSDLNSINSAREFDTAPPTTTSPTSNHEHANKLRAKANIMQDELGSILASVKSIKENCAKLKTENQSLQDYIESLMAKR